MTPNRTCENCGAYSALTNECRRHAPLAVMVQHPSGQPAAIGLFPATSKERWCGEWMPDGTIQ